MNRKANKKDIPFEIKNEIKRIITDFNRNVINDQNYYYKQNTRATFYI
jgi:hypothetical protein